MEIVKLQAVEYQLEHALFRNESINLVDQRCALVQRVGPRKWDGASDGLGSLHGNGTGRSATAIRLMNPLFNCAPTSLRNTRRVDERDPAACGSQRSQRTASTGVFCRAWLTSGATSLANLHDYAALLRDGTLITRSQRIYVCWPTHRWADIRWPIRRPMKKAKHSFDASVWLIH